MQFENETQVKEALEIGSWRNLSKDKFMTFVSALPDIDKDVAVAIVGQFPDFKALAAGGVETLKQGWDGALAENRKSQKQAAKAVERYMDALDRELLRNHWTNEERFELLRMLNAASQQVDSKDSENKAWLLKGLSVVAGAGVLALAAAVTVLGGKAEITKGPAA
ncbi:hypothetical protein [Amnibacterium endophyticum]|uniref:Uncharacterized protein n=1 Tax=Amnibacterium endophyticum TaxID=2109337 RepID=A0ABW4LF12_9MICO